ncbi:hypothetical protein [Chitinimonas naiadis]
MSADTLTFIFSLPQGNAYLPIRNGEHLHKAHMQACEASALASEQGDYRLQRPAREVMGSTRNDYANDCIRRMADLCSLPALAFLGGEVFDRVVHREEPDGTGGTCRGGDERITTLDKTSLTVAMHALRSLLSWTAAQPERLVTVMAGWRLQDIQEAVYSDVVSTCPALDHGRIRYAGDGDSPGYVFAYLRSVLCILEDAHKAGDVVVFSYATP